MYLPTRPHYFSTAAERAIRWLRKSCFRSSLLLRSRSFYYAVCSGALPCSPFLTGFACRAAILDAVGTQPAIIDQLERKCLMFTCAQCLNEVHQSFTLCTDCIDALRDMAEQMHTEVKGSVQ